MAIAVPDELQEREGPGTNRALRALCSRSASFRQIIARADMPWRPVEWPLPCQMNCRRAEGWALTGL